MADETFLHPLWPRDPFAIAAGHDRRIGNLERRRAGGIDFDADNEGGWLQINTNLGGATAVFADQTIENAGIALTTQDGSILALGTNNGGDVQIDSSNELFLTAAAGISLSAADIINLSAAGINLGAGGAIVSSPTTAFSVFAGTDVYLEAGAAGNIQMRLNDPAAFVVIDNNSATIRFQITGTKIFMPHLPTTNPGVADQVWRNGNSLMIV